MKANKGNNNGGQDARRADETSANPVRTRCPRSQGRPRRSTGRPRSRLALCLTLVCVIGVATTLAQHSPAPYHDGRIKELEYPGPGRDVKPPEGVQEVRIGYFGPSDPSHPRGGDPWLAASLAIAEMNQEGGFNGLPFRLLPVWSENPWGSGVSQLTRLVYDDHVWAIIGGIDGPSTHLAEQVVAKARLPLLNPFSTDKSVGYAFVPWMFSLAPGDHLQAPVLGDRLLGSDPAAPFVVFSATDHDSHVAAREYLKYLSSRGQTPLYHVQLPPGGRNFQEQLARIRGEHFRKLLIVAGAEDSAALLAALRAAGFDQPVFGTPFLERSSFGVQAGRLAEGAVFPRFYRDSPALEVFRSAFRRKYGRTPDYTACFTYDAVKLLGTAIRSAGLNRALIRDALRKLSGWRGVCGVITWDAVGQNQSAVSLASFQNGKIITEKSE